MSMLLDILSWVFAIAGGLFILIGTLGFFRMPDFPTRVHAASLIDIFGILLMMVAILLQYGLGITAMKVGLIVILLGVTSPIAIHAIFRAYRQTHPE